MIASEYNKFSSEYGIQPCPSAPGPLLYEQQIPARKNSMRRCSPHPSRFVFPEKDPEKCNYSKRPDNSDKFRKLRVTGKEKQKNRNEIESSSSREHLPSVSKHCASVPQLPHLQKPYTAVKNRVASRPVSARSEQDPELREFHNKIKEQREALRKERHREDQQDTRNQYFQVPESRKIRNLVSRQVAKVNRKLSKAKSLSCGKGFMDQGRKDSDETRDRFRNKMYKKLEAYFLKKQDLNKKSLSNEANNQQQNITKEVENQIKRLRSMQNFEVDEADKKQQGKSIYSQSQNKTASFHIKIQYERAGLKQIDFINQFENFSTNMERTRKSMQDYIKNSLFLVELQTDLRYKALRQSQQNPNQQKYGCLFPKKILQVNAGQS